MKNYRLVLGYDGTDFRGWQRQPDGRTVQGVLEDAVRKVTQKRTVVHGAGRTDAGVHALGQVASFRGAFKLSDEVLLRALNAVLPQDVRVFSLEEAPPGFHARKSARSKVYRYRIVPAAHQDVENAGFWVSRDALSAQNATSSGFPLILDWQDWDGNSYQITYNLVSDILQRNISINGGTPIQSTVAQLVNSDPILTNYQFANGVLTFKITSTIGPTSETRTYQIKLRAESFSQ